MLQNANGNLKVQKLPHTKDNRINVTLTEVAERQAVGATLAAGQKNLCPSETYHQTPKEGGQLIVSEPLRPTVTS